MLDTYGHVMADLPDERVSAEDAIRAARESQVSAKCPPDLPDASAGIA